jgi:hypothetical protein
MGHDIVLSSGDAKLRRSASVEKVLFLKRYANNSLATAIYVAVAS